MKTCTIDGCTRKHIARGWCHTHYARWKATGDPLLTLRKHQPLCTKDGCQRKHNSRGLCSRHFGELRRSEGYFVTVSRKPSARFTYCKNRSQKRGLEWIISFEEFCNLIKQVCAYCGGHLPETCSGLDRKDNSKGYSIDNVVPCCTHCNHLRSDVFTYEEFLEFSKTDLFKKILDRLHHRHKNGCVYSPGPT